MKIIIITIILSSIFSFPAVFAINYYLSEGGSNQASGRSVQEAWKSVERLNSVDLNAGDTVYFEGGKAFPGNIYMDQDDQGTSVHPIVLTSYGSLRAIINAGNEYGLFAYNTEGIEIRNLEFSGSGVGLNLKEGIHFYTDLKTGKKLEHIVIDNVLTQGFGKSGLCFGSWDSTYPGFKNVYITNTVCDNNETGMSTYDKADWKSNLYAHGNFFIKDCRFLNSVSSGIVLCGVDSAIVDYCRTSGTGTTGNAVVAMWAWSCRKLLFQYCIAEGTKTSGPDGGGFDLDGGCEECIIQYCYTYNNAGPGYMHCDYPYSRPTRKNIIRYCLSENDGRKSADNRCSYLFISWGNGLEDCHMYNNTGYISDNDDYSVFGLWGYIMFGKGDSPHITNCTARNNIFYVKGDHNVLANLEGGITPINPSNLLLQGNCYYAEGSGSNRWINNQSVFYSLDSWQLSTNQEKMENQSTGYNTNPQLISAGNAGNISNPHSLYEINAYKLNVTSPLIDAGINLNKIFNFETGIKDFYGNPSLQGNSQDIGIFESNIIESENSGENKNKIRLYPNPVNAENGFTLISEKNILSFSLISMNGTIVNKTTSGSSGTIYYCGEKFNPGIYMVHINFKNGDIQNMKMVFK